MTPVGPALLPTALLPAALLPTALLTAALLLASGCTAGPRTEARPGMAEVSVSAPPAFSAVPAPMVDVARPVLVLAADGLDLAAPGAALRRLPFRQTGSPVVRAAVEAALGLGERTELAGCGQGRRAAYVFDGFRVLLDGDRFVGWTEQGAPGRALATAQGLGLQSSLAELRAVLPDVEVVEGRVGTEWSGSGLSGRLDGPEGGVVEISGGETCVAR